MRDSAFAPSALIHARYLDDTSGWPGGQAIVSVRVGHPFLRRTRCDGEADVHLTATLSAGDRRARLAPRTPIAQEQRVQSSPRPSVRSSAPSKLTPSAPRFELVVNTHSCHILLRACGRRQPDAADGREGLRNARAHSFPNCSCEPGAPLAVDHRLTALRPNRNGDQAPYPPSSSTSSRSTEAAFRLRSGARTVVRPRATRSRSSRSSLAWAKPDARLRTFAGPTSRGLRATRTRLLLRLRTTSSHGAQAPGGFRFNLMISQAWQRTTTSRTPRRPNANAAILAPRIVSAW